MVEVLSGPSWATPVGWRSTSEIDSAFSNTVSLMIGTVKVRLTIPAANVRVPLTSV